MTGVPRDLSEANILGGVAGSEAGNDASEDDGDRGGRDMEDEELDSLAGELKVWFSSQGLPCSSWTWK
jgi:hypothetical protein